MATHHHDLTAKVWTVADVVSQFCRKYHIWCSRGINIEYEYANKQDNTVLAHVSIVAYDTFMRFRIRKKSKCWYPEGKLYLSLSDFHATSTKFQRQYPHDFLIKQTRKGYKFKPAPDTSWVKFAD